MRAIVLRAFGAPENLKLEEVPTPLPQAGEALVRVGAVSVDLYQMVSRRGGEARMKLPRIMGNGIAGTVANLGPGVEGLSPGARVVVANNVSCGECRYCRLGRDTLCAGRKIIGSDLDGGYAEFVCVPARDCVPLPDSVSFEEACLIPNTIGPVVKACIHTASIRAAENVVIIGAGGGMGLHAVQAARACGGRVIASLRSERTAEAVRQAGADVVICGEQSDLPEHVRQHTDGWGADVVLDFVANKATLQSGLAALAPAGRLVVMGYFPRGSIFETPTWVFGEERTVTGNRSARKRDVAESLALVRDGRIKALVDKVYPLEDVVLAHKAFEAKEIVGRAVLVP